MRVLFVCSGNGKDFSVAPFILGQAESLRLQGVCVSFFTVTERGVIGYLRSIRKLRKFIRTNPIDIIHAHYSFNGLLALLSLVHKPLVVSFMGSDTYGDFDIKGRRKISSYINIFISKLIQPFCNVIIVKSPNLARYIYCKKKLQLIPNGVDFDRFFSVDKNDAKQHLGLSLNKRYILFAADKYNERKNFALAQNGFSEISSIQDVELIVPYPVDQTQLNLYYNASDVVILTSHNEGSPNVVKEAMACNRPVVSTDVGDVRWLLGDELGYFISDFSDSDFSYKLRAALNYSLENPQTNGRNRLCNLGLSAEKIAMQIINIYSKVLYLK
ncbi:MAG TPA: glycosyltransferase family 4 protein [Tenuifilaceae bacterium]|nr:glycosyltransferase family 4 protein [Tenuifilaceae bacterium]HPN22670.1 glycosyltransferase family 4 protein [Tenuifilaceae bacterium]